MDAQSALDSLLGRLTTVLVSEAQLLGGVRGDVEFIRDEMENMDSLVAHIMEGQERDRQVRTWMRHVAGLSRDCEACVELYLHYVAPGGGGGKGLLAQLRWITQLVRTIPARRHVATRIRELKVRARDVGDRRSRYGITVPPALPVPDHQIRSTVDDSPCPASPQPCGPEEEKDDRRRELLFGEMPQAATKLVLQWLQQDNWSLRQEPPPRIIHILGEGAVGEREASTAKMVYDHPHVVSLFQHRFWISFQDNQSSSLFHKMSQLFTDDWKEAARAEGLLPGKKFLLLVLDDLRFNHTEYYGDLLRSILQDFGDRFDFIGATAILLTSRDWDDYTRELSDKTIFISAQGGQIHCPDVPPPTVHQSLQVHKGIGKPAAEETSAAGKIKTYKMHPKIHHFLATDVGFMKDTCLPLDLAHHFSRNSGIALELEQPSSSNDILSLLDSLAGSDQWKLLKVLDLEGCKGLTKKHLKNICNILLLKYLSLRDTDATQLPKQINKLHCLETLDIRQTKTRACATNSIFLPMLKHLLAGNKVVSHRFMDMVETVQLPSGTRRMKRLEILSYVDASRNVDDLIDIGQLLHLRKLGVILDGRRTGGLAVLFQQIEKLHGCLHALSNTLSIQINQPAASDCTVPLIGVDQQTAALASPPKLLQSLKISGITSGLPNWITELDQLTKITLSETYLSEDAIRVLGQLRILRCLRLRHNSYTGTKLTFNKEEFQHLRSLIVEGCSSITSIDFVNIGAAPKLGMIVWCFASVEALPLSGIDHLPKLKKLELNGDGDMVAVTAVRQAMEAHPNRPVFKHNSSHQRRQESGVEVAASVCE
ncbi:disease resistance protein PIK6-NP-like [Oryza brachyantha]|uniref:disease resistance protein PIK6-NP-like n=1 Tax=Oryza brachyantha TaxID=4533 RepID=UPI0003EA9F58|nr:disease resistance protein PIK6-NP-like [Oryza brachyantha]